MKNRCQVSPTLKHWGIKVKNDTKNKIKSLIKKNQIGFIEPANNVYCICKESIKDSLKNHQLIPFLGAGISNSAPSYVPLASHVINPLRQALWNSVSEIANIVQSEHSSNVVKRASKILEDAPMERLFDCLAQSYGDSGLNCLFVFDGKEWNSNHECIALLTVNGMLQKCITLNFDVLIEKGVEAKKGKCSTYCPLLNVTLGEKDLNAADLNIIKPHGSFPYSEEPKDRLRYLSGTLSQAGGLPDSANITAICEALDECSILLIAGYSNNDWDIFPIIKEYFEKGHQVKVIWVCHDNPQNARVWKTDYIYEILGKDKMVAMVQWIDTIGANGTILIGDVNDLLCEIIDDFGFRRTLPCNRNNNKSNKHKEKRKSRISNFVAELKKKPYNLALSLAAIINCEDEREFLRILLKYIITRCNSNMPEISNLCYSMLSWNYHMEGRYKQAISLKKRALTFKRKCKHERWDIFAEQYMTLGYHYLCCAKRPNFTLKGLVDFPLNIVAALTYFLKGLKCEHKKTQKREVTKKTFYFIIDYFHVLANALILLGPNGSLLIRLSHRIIGFCYRLLFAKFPELRGTEYYWMRELEAKLLGKLKRETFNELMRKLDVIENSCRLTLNQHHIGNVYVYKALLIFEECGDRNKACSLLKQAEQHWKGESEGSTGGSRSGLKRVSLFRRYIECRYE